MTSEIERGMDAFLASLNQERRELARVGDYLADSIVVIDWMAPDKELRSREEAIREFYAPIRASFPDVRFEVRDSMRSGNRLLVIGFFTGTMENDYWGFPAHGKRVRWEARDVYHFNGDGKIEEIWFANDTLTVARELGARVDDERLW